MLSLAIWHLFAFQREARRHFDCPTLNGMELENMGGSGTKNFHWKKRLVEVCYTEDMFEHFL